MASSMGPGKMITDGLVLHLDAGNTKSYPGSGTVWTDLSQTAITGSLTNGPTFSSINGGSIVLDGTNDYVEIGNNLNSYVNVSKPLSIEAVVTVISSSNNNVIIANSWDTAGFNFRKLTTNAIRFIYVQNGDNFRGIDCNVLSSGIYHLTATFDGSNVNTLSSYNLYVNGILNTSSSVQGGTITSVEPSRSISIGSVLDSLNGRTGYYSGSIHLVKIYNRALSAAEVFQNYEATRERFNRPTIVTDDDARNFLNSANISSETQQRAVNDLVVDMKNTGLWGKMKAIYPFVGGTAASHKWNLKDPRDVDAAFRLTFSGGWTHSSTGAKGNGTNNYADTYLVPNTHLSVRNSHGSAYARTDTPNVINDYYLFGSYLSPAVGSKSFFGIDNYQNPSTSKKILAGAGASDAELFDYTHTSHIGHFLVTVASNTTNDHRLFYNSTKLASNTLTSGTLSTFKTYLGALLYTGGVYGYSPQEIAFATIGDGLTDTDAANLYTIVQKYQTTLGRQV